MSIYKNTDLEFSLQQGTEKGGVYTNFYTEDKGSASIRVRLSSNGNFLDLTKTDLKPVLFLFHEDGSIFEIRDFINVMPDKGLIQYNLSDNVIAHAGKVKAKLFLKNTKQSVHVANFTFDIKDSGIEGAVEKEISVNIVDDAVRRIIKDNAIELLGDEFEQRLNTDVINHLDSNPDMFKGDKGDSLKYSELSQTEKEDLKSKITDQAVTDFVLKDESITENKLMDNSVGVEKVSFIKSSLNLLDKHDVITGKNIDVNNGELINSGSGVVFNKWFELKPGETYISNGLYARAFYDENKQFISASKGNSDFVVPINAVYTRFSTLSLDTAQLNIGSILKPYDEYFKPYLTEDVGIKGLPKDSIDTEQLKNNAVTFDKVDFINRSNNLLNKEKFKIGYAVTAISNGEPVANSTQNLSDFVLIEPNTVYTSDTGSTRVAFYDSNKVFVSQYSTSTVETKMTFTTPPNAKYLRINIYRTAIDTAMLNKGSELLPYEEWYEPLLTGVKLDKDNQTNTPVEVDKSNINYFAIDDHLKLDYTPPTITGIGVNDPIPAGNIAYTDYYTYYDELMESNPDYITKTLAGTDKDGREIYRYDFKPERPEYTKNSNDIERDFNKPKIFLVSSTHGNERTVIWALYNTMKLICEQWQDDEALEFLRWNAHFIVIPIISPGGYSNATRVNANRVDLNRNFTAQWENGTSDSTQTTYRGDAPLSEPEAKICDNILKNEDLTFVIDYHNFHAPLKSNYFNWLIGSSPFVNAIGEQLLSKMARKWKKQYPDLPQDSRHFGYISPAIEVGSMTNHATKTYGVSSALFEVCWKLDDKPNIENRDSFVSTIATDSVINYLILILKNANEL